VKEKKLYFPGNYLIRWLGSKIISIEVSADFTALRNAIEE